MTAALPAKSAYAKLPRRLKRFVDQYVVGGTAESAMLKAGYTGRHPRQIASKWLKKPLIQAAIDEANQRLCADIGIRQYTVLQQMHSIATSDPRKLEDENGNPIPLHKLDEATAFAIQSVEIEQVSSNGETGTRYKYKFWPKDKANDRLGQFVKLWEARATQVNVDARSVTVNSYDPAGQAALRAVEELGRRIAGVIEDQSISPSSTDGSLLPVAVFDGSEGSGEPVVNAASEGDSERP